MTWTNCDQLPSNGTTTLPLKYSVKPPTASGSSSVMISVCLKLPGET